MRIGYEFGGLNVGQGVIALFIFAGLAGISTPADGEELAVYRSSSTLERVSKYAVSADSGDEAYAKISTYKLGSKVGTIKTDLPFSEIAKKSMEAARGPFFGPGTQYIVRDSSNRYYLLFFEYKPRHQTFTGFRMGIGELNDLGSNGAVFVGHTYDGISFEQGILKQLRVITDKYAEQGGGGDSAGLRIPP